jgi:hypothetical protein
VSAELFTITTVYDGGARDVEVTSAVMAWEDVARKLRKVPSYEVTEIRINRADSESS